MISELTLCLNTSVGQPSSNVLHTTLDNDLSNIYITNFLYLQYITTANHKKIEINFKNILNYAKIFLMFNECLNRVHFLTKFVIKKFS